MGYTVWLYYNRMTLKRCPYSKILVMCQTRATASALSIYNIFVPQKLSVSKIFDYVIVCDLLPPDQKS